jgi:hypothetical protein
MANEAQSRMYDDTGHFVFLCCDNHLMALARGNQVTDKWKRRWKGMRGERGVYVEEVKHDTTGGC